MLSSYSNILALVLIPIIALIPDMTIKYFSQLYFPSESDKAIRALRKLKSSKRVENPKRVVNYAVKVIASKRMID
jgi:hypothetical protein